MGTLTALPIVLLLLKVSASIALPLLAAAAVGGTLYGCYWAMRLNHSDRAAYVNSRSTSTAQ
jgi:hypothetical protein